MTNNIADIGLFEAARAGDLTKLGEMLDLGAKINAASDVCFGKSALIIAAENNQLETVKFLISNGADINATDTLGRTAYFYAISGNNLALVKELTLAGATKDLKAQVPAPNWRETLKPDKFLKIFEAYDKILAAREFSKSMNVPQITLSLSQGVLLVGNITNFNFEEEMLTIISQNENGSNIAMFVPFRYIIAMTLHDADLCPEFLGVLYNQS